MDDKLRKINTESINYMKNDEVLQKISKNFLNLTIFINSLSTEKKIELYTKLKNKIKLNGLIYNLNNLNINEIFKNYTDILQIFIEKDNIIPNIISDDNIFINILKKYKSEINISDSDSSKKLSDLSILTENYKTLKNDINNFITKNKNNNIIEKQKLFDQTLINSLITNISKLSIDETDDDNSKQFIDKIKGYSENFKNTFTNNLKDTDEIDSFGWLYILLNFVLRIYYYIKN